MTKKVENTVLNSWTVADVQTTIERFYPPSLAENWDKNGLIVGDSGQQVNKILLAIDPVPQVVAEAITGGYDLIITHHPLFLKGAHFLNAQTPKGKMVRDLIKHDIALYNAHTNADSASRGVAWALAQALGLRNSLPFETKDTDKAGIPRGLGRVGELSEETTLEEFANRVAAALPAGPHGIFVGVPTGETLQKKIRKVAVSGGAGDSFLNTAVELGADVYVTADLRHHPTQDHLNASSTALISGSHWATESLWLPVLADDLRGAAEESKITVEVKVSEIVTEPWELHLPTKGEFS